MLQNFAYVLFAIGFLLKMPKDIILPFHYENFVNQGIKIGFMATVILLIGNYLFIKRREFD